MFYIYVFIFFATSIDLIFLFYYFFSIFSFTYIVPTYFPKEVGLCFGCCWYCFDLFLLTCLQSVYQKVKTASDLFLRSINFVCVTTGF